MAGKTVVKTFSATLVPSGNSLRWTVVWIPFDAAALWGVRGTLKVIGTINDLPFRSCLFPSGDGRHFMIVNRKMQKGASVVPGMKARFQIQPDKEAPPGKPVPELEQALRASRRLRSFYESLPPSIRKYVERYVSDSKNPQTRKRRAEQTAERLMETMEAEIELPPLIRQSFARNPAAGHAWMKLSPARRRSHLFGIFYYRNLDSRLRRIEKTVADLLGETD